MGLLNTPLHTTKLTFKNRLVYPPLFTGKAEEGGGITEQSLAYYDEKTKGGYFSLAMIEHCFISQDGKASAGQVSAASDSAMGGLSKLAAVIHKNGTLAVLQINHAGSCTDSAVTSQTLLAPSAVKNLRKGEETPKEMTIGDIKKVIGDFASAAVRAKNAGFDGVEIHSAHSYLLNQFYSPLTNMRTDNYGGSLDNRIRIHLEVIQAVREAVGRDFPIFLRLGACDYTPGGNQAANSIYAAKAFEKAGVDVLDISGGMCGYINPENNGPGYFGAETKVIHEAINIPVMGTGGIKEPAHAEQMLQDGVCNLVGVGRSALADSQWAKRAMEG